MIKFNATLVVQMINFAIFLFIMRNMLFKPLVAHIQKRRELISSSERKITEGIMKLEEAEKKYHEQLNEARKKAQEIINTNISSAEEEKHKIIKAVTEETNAVFEDFKAELAQETSNARQSLDSQVEVLANEIADKILAVKSDEMVLQGGNV
ncbi:MAG: ATP synthase F0 subunit B [Candidatus Sericytochromatia bacterium]